MKTKTDLNEVCIWKETKSADFETGCGEYQENTTDFMIADPELCPFCLKEIKIEV